jgi:citrate lyase beta subunit
MVAQGHRRIRPARDEKKGVIVVEGRMVERLHFGMAQRTVAIAEQIRNMEGACA